MKRRIIQRSLAVAASWERKGQPAWVSRCVSTALMNCLSLAVEEHYDADSAVAWLFDEDVPTLLSRHLDATAKLSADVDAGKLPGSALGENYHYLVFAHLAWLISDWGPSDAYVRIATRSDVLGISTRLWSEYARGVDLLSRGQEFRMSELRPRGQEKYWIAYLRLIEAASRSEPLDDTLVEIDRSFAARNVDKGIKDDAYEIEGSGEHPVRWDFRRRGLMNYIRSRSGQG
jgi:hypothetical protein